MSLAFELQAGSSPRLRGLVVGLHLIAVAALGVSAALLRDAFGPLDEAPAVAAALATAGAITVLGWSLARGLRSPRRGTLSVDSAGTMHWRAEGATEAAPGAATRWFSLFGLVWIEASVAGRSFWLVSGRDRCSDRVWAGVNRWLRWMERAAGA